MSLIGFPQLTALTVPCFIGEVRGHSQLYDNITDAPFCNGSFKLGVCFTMFMCGFFLWFTDFCIYWIHRIEHWPSVYKHIHKPHHKWVIPTPFASHAFHPLDGFVQSLPYHVFVYLFPLHRATYMGLFVFVNLWTIAIHDSDMIVGHPLESIINGPAHHTLHHMYFVYNYGQYFTWCDKLGKSYRHPKAEDDPLLTVLARDEAKRRYAEEKQELIRQEEQERQEEEESRRIAHSSIRESIPQAMLDAAATPLSSSPLLATASSQSTSTSGRRTPELDHSSTRGSSASASGNTSEEESSAESEVNTPREEEVASPFADKSTANSKSQRWSPSLRLGLSLTSVARRRKQ